MTDDEIRKRVIKSDFMDIVNTGKTFQDWRVYGIVVDKDFAAGKAFGLPMIFLVKGDEIRAPVGKEYWEVLALVNADYVGEEDEEDKEDGEEDA